MQLQKVQLFSLAEGEKMCAKRNKQKKRTFHTTSKVSKCSCHNRKIRPKELLVVVLHGDHEFNLVHGNARALRVQRVVSAVAASSSKGH